MPGVLCIAALLLNGSATNAQVEADWATVTVAQPRIEQHPTGQRVTQDVILANALASYTLRYDIIELRDDPNKVGSVKWAFTIDYVPLGLAGPSMALWYNQGFFVWTFDGEGIKEYPAAFRVVRDGGLVPTVRGRPRSPPDALAATDRCKILASKCDFIMLDALF